jgi:hypothetical protein
MFAPECRITAPHVFQFFFFIIQAHQFGAFCLYRNAEMIILDGIHIANIKPFNYMAFARQFKRLIFLPAPVPRYGCACDAPFLVPIAVQLYSVSGFSNIHYL